jgi:uncharacterized Zn-finger protein
MAERSERAVGGEIQVTKAELPLSCPGPRSEVASLHPRVYLPLKKSGDRATCPYCGAVYVLN